MEYRVEIDSLGNVRVPKNAYYGAQTQRARENFPISSLKLPPVFIRSLALIKKYTAMINQEMGLIDSDIAGAIVDAAGEVVEGKFNDQFVVDVFQTGSGTSTNMNMNEVIATRANEHLTGIKKTSIPVHPNDHVNRGQSSNDVIPSAIHMSAATLIKQKLNPSLKTLHHELAKKATAFKDIRKIGRTHLQDAVIMTLGNESSGYARQLELSIERLAPVQKSMAIATNLVTHIGYDRTAEIIQIAHKTDRTIESVALEKNILPKKELMLILYGDLE